MKYVKITESGFEVKHDSSTELPEGCIELTDQDYDKLVSGEFQFVNGEVIPYIAPVPGIVIPSIVSMRQARLALLQFGVLPMVDAAIAQGSEADKITWEYAAEVDRNSPLVANMKVGLNLSDADLDGLFSLAASL